MQGFDSLISPHYEIPKLRLILSFFLDKFSSVVGNVYEVNDYKVLPIYHSSPISPKNYNRNVEIFKKIETFL